MKVRNIIFDIGGVLAEPRSGHWFITPNFWNIIDKFLINEENLLNSLKKYLYLQTQEPKTEKEELEMFTNYYYEVLKELNYPNLTESTALEIAKDCVYNDKKFIFYDDVQKTLEELSKKYNLYIISNGWPSSLRVLNNMNLDKYFKDILISSIYSSAKEEDLFDIFKEKHEELNPKESLYIDDRRHIIDIANKHNFITLLMDRKHKYEESKYSIINNMYDISKYL